MFLLHGTPESFLRYIHVCTSMSPYCPDYRGSCTVVHYLHVTTIDLYNHLRIVKNNYEICNGQSHTALCDQNLVWSYMHPHSACTLTQHAR